MPFIRDVSANYQATNQARCMPLYMHGTCLDISRSVYIAIADSGSRGPRYIGALLYCDTVGKPDYCDTVGKPDYCDTVGKTDYYSKGKYRFCDV